MPGSPPISKADPGTIPAARDTVEFSDAGREPGRFLIAGIASVSSVNQTAFRALWPAQTLEPGSPRLSSSSVFQSPHDLGTYPPIAAAALPHVWQTN